LKAEVRFGNYLACNERAAGRRAGEPARAYPTSTRARSADAGRGVTVSFTFEPVRSASRSLRDTRASQDAASLISQLATGL
jgi:hypothetical protein